jgi:hypothetical protein
VSAAARARQRLKKKKAAFLAEHGLVGLIA